VNLEQYPSLDNRCPCRPNGTSLGCPRAELCLSWGEDETTGGRPGLPNVSPMHLRAQDLANSKRLLSAPVDSTRHHHAGTTRMGASAQDGVIDPDLLRVWRGRCYVAGASVFRPPGYANPVLTIVAPRDPAGRSTQTRPLTNRFTSTGSRVFSAVGRCVHPGSSEHSTTAQ